MNTFIDRPEFIERDSRIHRPWSRQYKVTTSSMTRRHKAFFQHTDLRNKRVLDLGCCCAATGAWVLDQGALHYTGVELQEKFVDVANQTMAQYYQQSQYKIYKSDVEGFVNQNTEKFDIVVLFGVLHCIFDWYSVLKNITTICDEIIIEGIHPFNGFKTLFPNLSNEELYEKWEQLSLVEIASKTGTAGEDRGSWMFEGVGISIAALNKSLGYLGWTSDLEIFKKAIRQVPNIYSLITPSESPRYITRATRTDTRSVWDFKDTYTDPTKTNYDYQPW